ncbi:hypothetical protein LXL04_020126 [Taraxacum kok-saghyz]
MYVNFLPLTPIVNFLRFPLFYKTYNAPTNIQSPTGFPEKWICRCPLQLLFSGHLQLHIFRLLHQPSFSPLHIQEMEFDAPRQPLHHPNRYSLLFLLDFPNQHSEIEETLVDLESYGVGNEAIDLEKLDGTWRLQYTSASDVLVLLDSSSRLPFLQVFCFFSDPYPFPLV